MSSTKDRDFYVGWLADAHSTETALISALENHINDAKDFPELRAGLETHLGQTRQHAELIKGCLQRQGGDPSALRNTMTNLTGTVKNLFNAANDDEVIKNTLDDFMAEHLEIGAYTALIAAAEQFGDQETAGICRRILAEEEEAARLLLRQIPLVTRALLRSTAMAGH